MATRGRPPKNQTSLKIVKRPVPTFEDFPHTDIAIPDSNGQPSELTYPVEHFPWADTVARSDWRDAVLRADSPKALQFLTALADPLQHDVPISVIASRSGIRIPELLSIWRDHMKATAMAVALTQAPLVAQHTLEDAKSITVCCGRCDGAGTMRVLREEGLVWITCKTCKGSGEVQRPGDPKSREWVLKAAGVIAAESNNLTLNLQNNIGADSVLDELDHLDQSARTIDAVAIQDNDA